MNQKDMTVAISKNIHGVSFAKIREFLPDSVATLQQSGRIATAFCRHQLSRRQYLNDKGKGDDVERGQ